MNPTNVPNSYKNFLPSGKFIKIVGAVLGIAILGFFIPKLIIYLRSHRTIVSPNAALVVSVPSGDPTTRDSDGDGIPDWQEIAVGLNPFSGETTKGTPDPLAFQNIKTVIGANDFQNVSDNATDTDKLALSLYSDLSRNAQDTGSTSGDTVSAVTGAEVANYIQAAQAKNKTYASANLTVVDNSQSSVQTYFKAMNALNTTVLGKDFVTHVSSYIDNKETKNAYLSAQLATIDGMVTKLLAIPVPSTAAAIHLAGINALSGIEQTINSYDPTTTDSLSQLGTVALIQDYTRAAIISNANLGQYFSVALETKTSR
ncbi:MAG: hypothetical protein JWM20_295 [Patescibacteria group bacterium]|nr:hypothetical protein [Patescibacteria group bacterium]